MKYFLLIIALIISLGICYSVFSEKPQVQSADTFGLECNNNGSHPLSHSDSIKMFVNWYAAMTDTFCTLNQLEDFKEIGPKKNKELGERFSSWHILLSESDKKEISECLKNSMEKLIPHSCEIMRNNGHLSEEISQDQIDIMIEMGNAGIDVVMDTTTYLDYFIRWTVDNYSPPVQ